MTIDDSGLSNCVVFSCRKPSVMGGAYCDAHMSLVPAPSPPAPVDDPAPVPPDPSTMEPEWDGTNWILKPKVPNDASDRLRKIQGLVRELMSECGIQEADGRDNGPP